MKQNKVYIVGAGPGDPGLITVKGLNTIKNADVILYDSLVNPSLLIYRNNDCHLHYCGKRGGEASFPQDEINKLLIKYFSEGKNVVRLKGGDSWVFSRACEEVESLNRENIPFEIVPGISSALAVPAYSGVPITHRDISSSFAIATGHPRSEKSIEDIPIPKADSIIYLMGFGNLEYITGKLIKSGISKETPAALIENGTTSRQRKLVSTLENIYNDASNTEIKPPVIFITGEAINKIETHQWFEKMPLFGKKLVITRPLSQAKDMFEKLSGLGADIVVFPTIEIRPNPDSKNFFLSQTNFNEFTDIIFTSENGVRIFFENLNAANLDSRVLSGIKVHAIGPTTKRALIRHGIIADYIPTTFTSAGLLEAMEEDLTDREFLLARAAVDNSTLENGLSERNAKFHNLDLYSICKPENNLDADTSNADGVIIMSSLSGKHFAQMKDWPNGATAFCIGERAAEFYRNKNINISISNDATAESVVENIVEYFKTK